MGGPQRVLASRSSTLRLIYKRPWNPDQPHSPSAHELSTPECRAPYARHLGWHFVCEQSTVDDDAIPLFIEHGADLRIRNNKGQTVMEDAKEKGTPSTRSSAQGNSNDIQGLLGAMFFAQNRSWRNTAPTSRLRRKGTATWSAEIGIYWADVRVVPGARITRRVRMALAFLWLDVPSQNCQWHFTCPPTCGPLRVLHP